MSRFHTLALLTGAALSALLIGPARADDDTITITARAPVKETASSVTMITADDIERRQVTTVFEALRGAPGVQLTQSGGLGQTTKVRLRGSQGNQVLTLIDGVPVNDPSATSVGGGYDFAYLDAGTVDRIEILRGAGSAIWGADAIGGVINIITLDPQTNNISAYAEGGSFSTGRIGARGNWTSGPLSLSGYATAFDTGGISAAEEHASPPNPEKDPAHAISMGARARLNFGAGLYGQSGFRVTTGRSDFDNGFPIQDADFFSTTRDEQADARVGWRSPSGASGVEAMAIGDLTKRYYSNFGDSFRGEREQYRLTGDTTLGGDQKVLAGYEHEDLKILGGTSNSNAVFTTYSGRPLKLLLVEGGLRYQDDNLYGSSTTGRIAGALDVWSGGALRTSYSTGFRAPSIDESLGTPAFFIAPNPNLIPEQSREWEAGVDQKLFGGAVKLSAVYFDRNLRNQIAYGPGACGGNDCYINIARSEAKGGELSAEGTIGAWTMTGSYTHTKAFDKSNGLQLQRVPKDEAALDVSFQATSVWSVGGAVIYNGEEREPVTNNPSWTRLDLRTAYKLSSNAEIYARIENATDKDYQDVPGYGTPDRSAYVGIRVKN